MLLRIVKGCFALIGMLTGFTLTRFFFYIQGFGMYFSELQMGIIYTCVSIILGILFLASANRFVEALDVFLSKMESTFHSMSMYEIVLCCVGLIVGLVIANLVSIPVTKVNFIGIPIAIIINILLGFIGISLAYSKKSEVLADITPSKKAANSTVKNGSDCISTSSRIMILDTSAIIDGRIADICKTGFVVGSLIIPGFVLEELRHIADCPDSLKRNRGKRGLDILGILQKELELPVMVDNTDFGEVSEVDDKILKLAAKTGGSVVTTDYNLNKVAGFQGVEVLNVNDLTNAVKAIALPGEEMSVQIIKDGKESGQGLGYLDDGTMIVVEGGRKHIGQSVEAIVTSVLQTSAGRMIFAKLKYGIEKVI